MPLQETSGNATADAYGGGAAVVPTYIENVFSTYLYAGNGSTVSVTNNIDLSTNGGLVWFKDRTSAFDHRLFDTARGATQSLATDLTTAQTTGAGTITFGTSGFTTPNNEATSSRSGENYVSWTFRKKQKFFDVVTFTQASGSTTTFNHNLGSVPGCIIFKPYSAASFWLVYHTSTGANSYLGLNNTSAATSYSGMFSSVTSTSITVNNAGLNATGDSCVAYLFAHNAGGFGLTGTDNVISCGSFTTDGSGNATVNLGYEPQYVLYKKTSTTGQWYIEDTMRGLYAPSQIGATLIANLSNAEGAGNGSLWLNSTGFTVNPAMNLGTNTTCIYIAIRRGPMKVPTSGTSVFVPAMQSGTPNFTTGFPVDMFIAKNKTGLGAAGSYFVDRLRGNNPYLDSTSTAAEVATGGNGNFDNMTGAGTGWSSYFAWLFRRAPSFFDEVCYTGTGSATTQTHGLTVVPEMMIVKRRDTTGNWRVYCATLGNAASLFLNGTAGTQGGVWDSASPTASVFSVGTDTSVNASGGTYVNYLFATLAGVSKVGSYTGTGATQTINCGFTGGARFVLIKRTDTNSNWYVWDTTRGMVSGTDPSLSLNTTSAESNANSVYTITTGFQLLASPSADVNTNGGSYIFLAIA